VVEKVATLSEVDGPGATYSLVDLYKANALLDMQADIEKAAHDKAKKESGRRR